MFSWTVVLVIAVSLVLVGPTSFPRVVDGCSGPVMVRDNSGYCIARGRLGVLTEENDVRARAALVAGIQPLGGFISMDSPELGSYEVTFPAADTLDKLLEAKAALQRLGFHTFTLSIGELFDQ